MKLSEKQQIFSKNIALLIFFADSQNIGLTFGHAWRSLEDQKRLFETKKTKTLNSQHLNRLAVDFNFFIGGVLTYKWEDVKPLGDFWVSLHPQNRWGGDWNKNGLPDGFIDTPHFEML
ncbi:M15 family metallopeptidase [Salegentibacter sp. HM20]